MDLKRNTKKAVLFDRTSQGKEVKKEFKTNLDILEEAAKEYYNYYDPEGKKLYLGNLIEIKGEISSGSKTLSKGYSLSEKGKGEPYFIIGFDNGSEVGKCNLYDKPQFYLKHNGTPELIEKGKRINYNNQRIKKCLETLSKNPLVPSDKRFINRTSKN